MKRLILPLIPILAAACAGPRSSAEPDPAKAPNAVAPAATANVPVTPMKVAEPVKVARPEPAFSVMVEGKCDELDVDLLENTELVHYGHVQGSYEPGGSRLVVARVLAEGGLQEEPMLMRGLKPSGDEDGRPFYLSSVSGSWPEKATATLFAGGERSGTTELGFTWAKDHWAPVPQPAEGTAEEFVAAHKKWMNETTLNLLYASGSYPAFAVKPAGKAPTPDFGALHVKRETDCMFEYGDMHLAASGEMLLAGRYCGIFPDHTDLMNGMRGEAAVARWSPGGRGKLEPIPKVANNAALRLQGFHEASPMSLYLFGVLLKPDNTEDGSYLAHFDGTAWSRIEAPYKGTASHEIDAEGNLWVVADEAVFKLPPSGTWEKQPLEAVTRVVWSEHRPAWALSKKQPVRRATDGTWAKINLPKPAFSVGATFEVTDVKVSPRGEAWLGASYTEKRPQWTQPEERQALLRYGTSFKTTRCEAGGPTDKSFTVGWPAPATEACATPFALLVRVSKAAPKNYDYPQTRAVLRGHTELEGSEFVDIELDGRTYFGARPKTLEMGQKLVSIVGKGVAGTHPELVCLAPEAIRTLPLDLATGAVRPAPAGLTASR